VRLVVDANILYSVILKTEGRVADVFFNTRPVLDLVAPLLLKQELQRHRSRMAKQTGKTIPEITLTQELLLKRVTFIDDALIDDNAWATARKFVKQVDPDDEDFVALALHLNCPLWTGDNKLSTALKGSGVRCLSSAEIREMHTRR